MNDLSKSVDFYRRLLLLEPSVRNDTAALLIGPGCYQLYLTCIGSRASRDPDDVPVLVTYPGRDQAPRQKIIRRIYDW